MVMKQNCIFAEIFTHCDSCWRQRDGSKMVFFGSRQEESYFDYVEFYGGPTQRETQKHQKDNWVFSQRDFTSSRQIVSQRIAAFSTTTSMIRHVLQGVSFGHKARNHHCEERGCFWLKSVDRLHLALLVFAVFPDASSHLISFEAHLPEEIKLENQI